MRAIYIDFYVSTGKYPEFRVVNKVRKDLPVEVRDNEVTSQWN